MLSIFAIAVLFTSCGETVDESQVLIDYLESVESAPFNAEGIAKYIVASDVQALLPDDAYVIDIRSADAFNAGHIAGAVNVAEASVIAHLDDVDTGDKKIVITCVTGQTAAFVSSLARLAGHDTWSLKFGMCSWNVATADALIDGSQNTHDDDLVTTVTDKGAAGTLPVLETGFETAAEILDARIATVVETGFGGSAVTAGKVFDTPGDYYIMNYWKLAHYEGGHIPGAIQYTPNVDILSSGALNTLPTDKQIVVYCYTGQTSAYLTAYLRVLGYDALSLKFGVNGFATDWLTQNSTASDSWPHWSNSYISGYDLSTD